jgi:histidine ammonia-lyase
LPWRLDHLCLALSEIASISERRIYRLLSGKRGFPLFLVANPGLNSGFMIPQYTAASIVSQNKQLCTPASVDTIESSQGQEDHVSMGANAATKALKVVEILKRCWPLNFIAPCRHLNSEGRQGHLNFLKNLPGEYRKLVSFIENDRIMYEDMRQSVDFSGISKLDVPGSAL